MTFLNNSTNKLVQRLGSVIGIATLNIMLCMPMHAQTHKHEHSHNVLGKAADQSGSAKSTLVFTEKTWAQLLKDGPKPAAYLFTTTYCSTCPAAFDVLHQATREQRKSIPLMAVMMDASGAKALRHANHFKGMTKMYAFEGFEPEIRQSVDPAWPNVTPYVVMVDATGKLQKVIGPPTPDMLKRWLNL